ncbi:MAG TPA: hypothetical protein VD793_00080 [Gemmatimonadales bacterium]|nr:hypothetical protein [Gemmatimonadales bacterium]
MPLTSRRTRPRQRPAGFRQPRLVELVGPAGAGKSTLARALPARDWDMAGLTLWGLPRRFLLAAALALIPTAARAALRGRPLRWGELVQMARLGALRREVRRTVARGDRLILLDEGPVFGLGWLEVFFPRNGDTAREAWRHRTVRTWAACLDLVVQVDAPDSVLADRIRTRAKPHMVKHRPDDEVFGFTARFRRALDHAVADLKHAGRVRVLGLRTDGASAGDHATRLRCALDDALSAW